MRSIWSWMRGAQMEDPVGNAILAQYFRRLEKALRGLPPDRREQIIDDLRTHVDECLQAETEHSDATVLAILDRVGDPDEIAREALADDAFPATQEWATGMESASASRRSTRDLHQWRLGASVVALLLAVAAVAIS